MEHVFNQVRVLTRMFLYQHQSLVVQILQDRICSHTRIFWHFQHMWQYPASVGSGHEMKRNCPKKILRWQLLQICSSWKLLMRFFPCHLYPKAATIFKTCIKKQGVKRYTQNKALWKCFTLISLSPTWYNFSKWSKPKVALRSAVGTKVSLINRRNIELFPTPYSPHKITLRTGVLTTAMADLTSKAKKLNWILN